MTARNQKLTNVIKGRRIKTIAAAGPAATITFDDGSTMTIKLSTDGAAPPQIPQAAIGDKVAAVRQSGTTLQFVLAGGEVVEMHTLEPTASVMLRDKEKKLEYAD